MASHGELADDEHDADHGPDLQFQLTAARDGPCRDVFFLGGGTPLLAVLVDGQVVYWASRSTSDLVTWPVVVRCSQV